MKTLQTIKGFGKEMLGLFIKLCYVVMVVSLISDTLEGDHLSAILTLLILWWLGWMAVHFHNKPKPQATPLQPSPHWRN